MLSKKCAELWLLEPAAVRMPGGHCLGLRQAYNDVIVACAGGTMDLNADAVLEALLMVPQGEVSLAHALGMHHDVMRLMVKRAQALVNQGKLDEAEEILGDLNKVDIYVPNIPFLLGICRHRRKDYPQAIAAYSQALRRGKGVSTKLFVQRIYMCRALALLAYDKRDRAARDFERVANGGDPTFTERAQAWLKQHRADMLKSGAKT